MNGSAGSRLPVRILGWCAFLVLVASFVTLYFYEISHNTDEGVEDIWKGFHGDLTWRLKTLEVMTITNEYTINLFFWW